MFEPITTQEQFEGRLKDRLARQCEQHRQELASYRAEHERQTLAIVEQLEVTRRALVEAVAVRVAAELGYINPAAGVRASDATHDVEASPETGQVDDEILRERLAGFADDNPFFVREPRRSTA